MFSCRHSVTYITVSQFTNMLYSNIRYRLTKSFQSFITTDKRFQADWRYCRAGVTILMAPASVDTQPT